MQVTAVEAWPTVETRAKPIRDALQTLDALAHCHIAVETEAGVTGQASIYFGRVAANASVLAKLVNEVLAPAVVGEDAFMVRGIRDKLWQLTDYSGTLGLALHGIAGIDIALWDAVGKALEQPVWRLLGGHRDRVPTYAMVGWLNYSLDELRSICGEAMVQGFRGVKVKVGAPTLDGRCVPYPRRARGDR